MNENQTQGAPFFGNLSDLITGIQPMYMAPNPVQQIMQHPVQAPQHATSGGFDVGGFLLALKAMQGTPSAAGMATPGDMGTMDEQMTA